MEMEMEMEMENIMNQILCTYVYVCTSVRYIA